MKKGMMKSIVASLVMAIIFSTGAIAQKGVATLDANSGNKPTPEERANKRTDQMIKKLELNDRQAEQVRSLNLAVLSEVKSIKNSDIPREDKKDKVRFIRDRHIDQISAILTTEQNVKFEKWLEKKKDKRAGKGKKGGKGQLDSGDARKTRIK